MPSFWLWNNATIIIIQKIIKEIKFEFVILLYSKLNDWLDTSYEYQNT